jgi:hypothetical protein
MFHARNIPHDGKTACGLEITETVKIGYNDGDSCYQCQYVVDEDIRKAITETLNQDLLKTLFGDYGKENEKREESN